MRRPKGKYAWSVTVGAKGQIVIPKEAREIFGIAPGDTLLMLRPDEGDRHPAEIHLYATGRAGVRR